VRPSFTSCQGSKVSLHWQTLRVGVLLLERELCSTAMTNLTCTSPSLMCAEL
jgi:hypothetical protein